MRPASFQELPQSGTPPGGLNPLRNNTALRQQVFQILRAKPPPPGWQQPFRIDSRASFILQITNQLFLLKPALSDQKALDVAVSFEEREFNNSNNEQAYREACYRKLQEIANTRQNQAMQTQRRMNEGMMPGGQQQFFQPAMVNPSPIPQGFSNPTPQPQHLQMQSQAMEQQQQQQFQRQQLITSTGATQNFANPAVAPNMNQQAGPMPGMQGTQDLTPQEKQMVNQRAAHIANNLTPEQRQDLAAKAQTVAPQVKAQLAARGMNAIQLYIQNEAVKQLRMQKQRDMLNQQNPGLQMPNGGPQGMPQLGMQQQGIPPQQQGMLTGGNINQQILAQQQEAVRRQQQGQQVVPGNPGGMPGNMQPNQQQAQQASRSHAGWQGQQPQGVFQQQNQSLWNNQQNRQVAQNQPQAAISGGPPNSNLQGQKGGLVGNTNIAQHHQTPALPTLNQPMDPPGQAQAGPSPRVGQGNAQQQNGGRATNNQAQQMGNQPNSNQQRPGNLGNQNFIQNLPPQIRQQLASMPSDDHRRRLLQQIVAQQRERHSAQARAQQNMPQTQPGLQQPQQPQQPQPGMPARPMNNQNAQVSMVSGQPPNVGAPNAGNQRQPSSNQPPVQASLPRLNEQQLQQMDRIPFPSQIRTSSNIFSGLPADATTWRDLKQYIAQNAHLLPPDLPGKLNDHQALHFSYLQNPQRMRQAPNNAAPMNQQVPNGQQQMSRGPIPMQQIPQITQEDIHNIRQSNPTAANMSDDQIRAALLNKRRQALNMMPPNAANMHPHQQVQQRLMQLQHAQANPTAQAQPTAPQAPPPQPPTPQAKQAPQRAPQAIMTQTSAAPAEKARQAPANQTASKNIQKNLKRHPTNDDVIEIADPNLSKQAGTTKAEAPPPVPMPNLTQQQFDALPQQQKVQFVQQQMQRKAAATNQHQPPQSRPGTESKEELAQANRRLKEILAKVVRSMGKRNAQPMPAKTKIAMVQKLKSSKPLAERSEMALTFFLKWTGNEEKVSELCRLHLLLMAQYRDTKDYIPIEGLTISSEQLDDIVQKLQNQVGAVFTKLQGARTNMPNQGQASQPNQPGANQPSQRPPAQAQPQKLTAASLKHHQDELQKSRAATLQKNQDNNKPPAAPTASQPPFPLGQQSPQGHPYYYNPENQLTQDKLVLPANKRRKGNQNSAATTPAQTVQTPGQQTSPPKSESPVIQRTPVPPKIKCNVDSCKSKALFEAQADLDKHVAEAHPPKEEEIKDPLAYCLESFRYILNLDENGMSRPVDLPAAHLTQAQPSAMKKTASTSSQPLKRQASSTPMSLNPTGPSPLNNANNGHLKTPQSNTQIKTPASDTKATLQTIKSTPLKSVNPNISSSSAAQADPWANAKVPKTWFPTVFSGVADLNRPVSADFLTDWLSRNPFNLDSSESSQTKLSPHESDISPGDDLNISFTADGEDDGWLNIDGEIEGFGFGGQGEAEGVGVLDPILEMDWETAFGNGESPESAGVVSGGVSEEFLRVYKPEELEAKKRGDRERRERMGR